VGGWVEYFTTLLEVSFILRNKIIIKNNNNNNYLLNKKRKKDKV
jgi:hypothetical protein